MAKKNAAAVRLARLRMVKMTPEQRSAVAALGGRARATKPESLSVSGQKGGAARAVALTPERRSEIARQAARTRWAARRQETS